MFNISNQTDTHSTGAYSEPVQRLLDHARSKSSLFNLEDLEKISTKSELHSEVLKTVLGLSHLDRFGSILTNIKGSDILNSNPIHVGNVASYLARKNFFNGIRPHSIGDGDNFSLILDPGTLRYYKDNPDKLIEDIEYGKDRKIKVVIPIGLFYCSPFTTDSIDQLEAKIDSIVETYDRNISFEENLLKPIQQDLFQLLEHIHSNKSDARATISIITNKLDHIDEIGSSNFEENPSLDRLTDTSQKEVLAVGQYLSEHARIFSCKDVVNIMNNLLSEISAVESCEREDIGLFVFKANKSYGMLAWVAAQELGIELSQFSFEPNESQHKVVCIFDDFVGSGVSLYEAANYYLSFREMKIFICPLVTSITQRKRKELDSLRHDKRIKILDGISVAAADGLSRDFNKVSKKSDFWNQFGLNTAVAFPWGAPDNCSELWGSLKLWVPRNLKNYRKIPVIDDEEF